MIRKNILGMVLGMMFVLAVINFISAPVYSPNLGCCFDPSIGMCSPNTDQADCGSGATWTNDESCASDSHCIVGCCLMGTSTGSMTQRLCQLEANARGFEFDWRQISSAECTALGNSLDKGACIYPGEFENDCIFTTSGNCPTGASNFYQGLLCTAPQLNTTYEKSDKTTLVDGQDGIYYLDDHDNLANIYDYNRYEDENYWTYVIDTSDSCGATDATGNANSKTCGNCDFNRSSIGRYNVGFANQGNYYCADLACGVVDGEERSNGEGWCASIDEQVAAGLNVLELTVKKPGESVGSVGSRFMKKFCLNGEVHNEPCDDYRMEFCQPGENESANCMFNPWQECLLANSGEPDPITRSTIDEEACDSQYCYISRLDDCVQFQGDSEVVCGEDRDNWREYARDNTLSESGVMEVSSKLMMDLNLPLCLPKIPGGIQFWPSGGSFSVGEGGACSMGNFEREIKFKWADSEGVWYLSVPNGQYGGAGIISLVENDWDPWGSNRLVCEADNPIFKTSATSGGSDRSCGSGMLGIFPVALPASTKVMELLNARCQGVGDCDGKANWVGGGGGPEEAEMEGLVACSTSGKEVTCSFMYECLPFKAPSGSSSCSECQEGEDDNGIPCTEYRCKALGQNCDFDTAGGKGYCTASNDFSAPVIGHSKNPNGLVPPFTPIEINITTNEISYCRFNIGNSGGTYSEMDYDVDSNWTKRHKIRLTLPGQIPGRDDYSEYNLIQSGGLYKMFVRCSDVAGNWNINSHLVNFEVMQTPDKNPPTFEEFQPISGSPILFETTEKEIRFRLNEPAECNWDSQDKTFSEMGNNFTGDNVITDMGSLDGYWCSGILPNVTNNSNEFTKYYIRCKDQPWLETNNPDPTYYSRNANPQSIEYSLTASTKLEVSSFTPSGNIDVGPQDTSVELYVQTSGGGYNGKSVCKWKILEAPEAETYSTLYYLFSETNSSVHTQILANRSEGNYIVGIECEDEAGNVVNATTEFDLEIDDEVPEITRIFKSGNDLKLLTSELAKCYFYNWGCNFIPENGTSMTTGFSNEHRTVWNSGFKVHVKCLDIWNNQEGGCVEIIRPGIF